MAVRGYSVSVTATPTLVAQGRGSSGPQGVSDMAFHLYNNGSATVWLGGPDVDPNKGTPMVAGATAAFSELGADDLLYAAVSSGSCDVRVIELG